MDLSYIVNSPDVERIAAALETISGDASDAIEGKVDTDQGTANAGKTLIVGNDGAVTVANYGFPPEAKEALLELFRHVAYTDAQPEEYFDALVLALEGRAVASLTVSFSPGTHMVYEGDTMASLRPYLTVTAVYYSGRTETATDYTLSGALVTGTQTVTVALGGKTQTFSVTVVTSGKTYIHNWDFSRVGGLTDIVSEREAVALEGLTLTHEGAVFNAAKQHLYLGHIYLPGKTIEIDVASFAFAGDNTKHIRLLSMFRSPDDTTQFNPSTDYYANFQVLAFRYNGTGSLCAWNSYLANSSNTSESTYANNTGTDLTQWRAWSGAPTGNTDSARNCISGKKIKIVFDSNGKSKSLYLDGTLAWTENNGYCNMDWSSYIHLGGYGLNANSGDQFYNAKVTGFRVYANS